MALAPRRASRGKKTLAAYSIPLTSKLLVRSVRSTRLVWLSSKGKCSYLRLAGCCLPWI